MQEDRSKFKNKMLWNRISKSYDKRNSEFKNGYELSIKKIKQNLQPDQNILEIACVSIFKKTLHLVLKRVLKHSARGLM